MLNSHEAQEVAERINLLTRVIQLAWHAYPLMPTELDEFKAYVQSVHNVGPIFNPTAYREMLHADAFEQVSDRLDMLIAVCSFMQDQTPTIRNT